MTNKTEPIIVTCLCSQLVLLFGVYTYKKGLNVMNGLLLVCQILYLFSHSDIFNYFQKEYFEIQIFIYLLCTH